MNISILGYPGSGKSTQGKILSAKLGMVHVSFGDIFWREIAAKTPLGHEVSDYLLAGRLVPDWLVLDLLKNRFAAEKRGFIFDGFPRNVEQAEALDAWLASRSSSLNAVFLLQMPEAAAAKRLAERRECANCGAMYNRLTQPPFMENMCDSCAGKLTMREDDKPEPLKKRFMIYNEYAESLVLYYKANVNILEVKADQSPQAVTSQMLSMLKPGAK